MSAGRMGAQLAAGVGLSAIDTAVDVMAMPGVDRGGRVKSSTSGGTRPHGWYTIKLSATWLVFCCLSATAPSCLLVLYRPMRHTPPKGSEDLWW